MRAAGRRKSGELSLSSSFSPGPKLGVRQSGPWRSQKVSWSLEVGNSDSHREFQNTCLAGAEGERTRKTSSGWHEHWGKLTWARQDLSAMSFKIFRPLIILLVILAPVRSVLFQACMHEAEPPRTRPEFKGISTSSQDSYVR